MPKQEIRRFKSGDRLKSKFPENKRRWAVTTGHPGLRPGYYLLYLFTESGADFLSIESWSDLKKRFVLDEEAIEVPR